MRTIVPLFLSVDDFWDTYDDERVIKEVSGLAGMTRGRAL